VLALGSALSLALPYPSSGNTTNIAIETILSNARADRDDTSYADGVTTREELSSFEQDIAVYEGEF
jgi:hypothetical protein